MKIMLGPIIYGIIQLLLQTVQWKSLCHSFYFVTMCKSLDVLYRG